MSSISYDKLVLGKEYIIKKDNIMYRGIYYMHYKKYHDGKEPLIFIEVTPNDENKKFVEINRCIYLIFKMSIHLN
jgi:hypothetical protein